MSRSVEHTADNTLLSSYMEVCIVLVFQTGLSASAQVYR